MDALDFYNFVRTTFDEQSDLLPSETDRVFLTEFKALSSDCHMDKPIKMTSMSILFEGYYRHLDNSQLKQALTNVKIQRWQHHFGTPTITFLLSFKNQINLTTQYFDDFCVSDKYHKIAPWLIDDTDSLVEDTENNIQVNPASIDEVTIPSTREVTGTFTKTHNASGGFTTSACDPISLKFIERAKSDAKDKEMVLEIGAAFGAATLESLSKGSRVFCNDIEPENLAVVSKRCAEMGEHHQDRITGDSSQLVFVPGEFPSELAGLPNNFFDAILICRVLHFFPGSKIEESLACMLRLLKPGGKIYIICETPFLKNWQKFIPEFYRRVDEGIEWPGEITNPAEFENSGRASSLPTFVHWITKEILERSLLRTGFEVEHLTYINRKGQFPDDLLLPEYGQESVGAIGINKGLSS